jgi:flavin-dependent dehydrogenase
MFDGIIVGAGPAGSTAAYQLAKQGRSVLVLEKASLLRNKPRGGVSGAIAQWLDFDRTPAISLKANKISYTSTAAHQPVGYDVGLNKAC